MDPLGEDYRIALSTHDHLVHEAFGPALTARESGATIAVGVNSLLILGVFPVLFGALVDEHRLSNAGIGQLATLELLAMGLTTAAAGAFLKPKHLRLIGASTSVALALANLITACSGQRRGPCFPARGGRRPWKRCCCGSPSA